nr:hypothetical protein [Allomuricauda sp.]
MRYFKIIFDFYLNASIHVALAVMSLTGVTLLLLNIEPNFFLLAFVFFGTVVCYNFIKYGVEAEKYLIVSNTYHKYIQVFSFFCFGLALWLLWHLGKNIWWATLVLSVVSALYAIPLLPKSGNLRSLGGLKIIVVALVWGGITVFLPVLHAKMDFSWDVYVIFAQRIIFVLALLVPFEIRDLKYDAPDLRTLPQVFGVKNSKILGVGMVVVSFFLLFLKDKLEMGEVLSLGVASAILIALFLSKTDMGKHYLASFWVEGIPMLWLGMYLVLEKAI